MEGPANTPRPNFNPDSYVTFMASSGENDGESYDADSCENSPTSSANTPKIAGHICELEQIH